MPNKPSVSGASLGYTPSMQGMPPRVQGETEEQYRRRVRLLQGEQARALATQRGIDTSGMAWNGSEFYDANADHWYSDPRVLGPIAVAAGPGIGALANPSAVFSLSSAPSAAPAAASAGAGGVIPSSSIPVSSLMGGPAAASSALTAGAGGAGAAGLTSALANGASLASGKSLLDQILDWAPVGAAAFGAGKQLLQGPPQAQQDLERILKLAEDRINASQPNFDQLNRFVTSRMPDYVKGQ